MVGDGWGSVCLPLSSSLGIELIYISTRFCVTLGRLRAFVNESTWLLSEGMCGTVKLPLLKWSTKWYTALRRPLAVVS